MGGTSDTWVTPNNDSSCSESAATDTSADKGRCMRRWGSFPSSGGVGGGRFAARTVAVRSYPRVSRVPPFTLPEVGFSGQNYLYYYVIKVPACYIVKWCRCAHMYFPLPPRKFRSRALLRGRHGHHHVSFAASAEG